MTAPWTRPRLVALDAETSATARCDCPIASYRHAAVYRAEVVHGETGEIRVAMLCFERGRSFAKAHNIDFPPWKDPR